MRSGSYAQILQQLMHFLLRVDNNPVFQHEAVLFGECVHGNFRVNPRDSVSHHTDLSILLRYRQRMQGVTVSCVIGRCFHLNMSCCGAGRNPARKETKSKKQQCRGEKSADAQEPVTNVFLHSKITYQRQHSLKKGIINSEKVKIN